MLQLPERRVSRYGLKRGEGEGGGPGSRHLRSPPFRTKKRHGEIVRPRAAASSDSANDTPSRAGIIRKLLPRKGTGHPPTASAGPAGRIDPFWTTTARLSADEITSAYSGLSSRADGGSRRQRSSASLPSSIARRQRCGFAPPSRRSRPVVIQLHRCSRRINGSENASALRERRPDRLTHAVPVDAARAGVISPKTQTIRTTAGCHVNFFGRHAIRRTVIGAHRDPPTPPPDARSLKPSPPRRRTQARSDRQPGARHHHPRVRGARPISSAVAARASVVEARLVLRIAHQE
jgi:hypothetical protein